MNTKLGAQQRKDFRKMVRDTSKGETGEKEGVKQPAKEIAQLRVRRQQRTSLAQLQSCQTEPGD